MTYFRGHIKREFDRRLGQWSHCARCPSSETDRLIERHSDRERRAQHAQERSGEDGTERMDPPTFHLVLPTNLDSAAVVTKKLPLAASALT